MSSARRNIIYLCLVLTGVCLISIPFENGYTVWDEGGYVSYAIKLARGIHFSLTQDLFANRFGTYLLPALFIKVFGFSENLTWIFTAWFAITLVATYACLRYKQPEALITVALIGFSPIMIQESSRVMSDVPGTMMASLPLLMYLWHIHTPQSSARKTGLLAGFIFGYSAITRESFVFVLPAILWVAATGSNKKFWWHALASFMATAFIVIVFYAWQGQLWARFQTVYSGHIMEECGYAAVPAIEKLKRFTYQPLQMMMENFSYGVLLPFAGLNFITTGNTTNRIIRAWLLITLGMLWLCPETLTHFNPVPLAPRLWIPVIVPLAVNAAFALPQLQFFDGTQKLRADIFTVLFALAGAIVLLISRHEHAAHHRPNFTAMLALAYIAIIAGLMLVMWMKISYKTILILALIILLQAAALLAGRLIGNNALKAVTYRQEKKALLTVDRLAHPGDYLLVDPALNRNHIIYGDIVPVKFWAFDDKPLDSLKKDGKQIFLYLNKERVTQLITNLNETGGYTTASYPPLPTFVLNPDKDFKLIDSSAVYTLYVNRQ